MAAPCFISTGGGVKVRNRIQGARHVQVFRARDQIEDFRPGMRNPNFTMKPIHKLYLPAEHDLPFSVSPHEIILSSS